MSERDDIGWEVAASVDLNQNLIAPSSVMVLSISYPST